MHEGFTFLQDLAVVMAVAGLVTVLFHRLRQPVVLGYILAGLLIAHPPWLPARVGPLIRDLQTVQVLSGLGVIVLLFSLGLQFSFRRLMRVGATGLVAGMLEIPLMFLIGFGLGRAFGWEPIDSLFLGAILSISSTTIIAKTLEDMGRLREPFAELIFGILVVEDILAIAMIALLSGLAGPQLQLDLPGLATTVGKLAIFLTALLVVGLLTVPRLLQYVASFRSREMLLITSLALCFGVALLALRLGYSYALGAFMIGAVMAESRQVLRLQSIVEPIRDLFAAIFFVAIGMLIEPTTLVTYAWTILAASAAVVLGKIVTCSLGTFVGGHSPRTSLRVGMGMAQIGEFSFIIATLGQQLGIVGRDLYPIAVSVSAVTTLLLPQLIRYSDTAVGWFERAAPKPLLGYLELYSSWTAHGRRTVVGPADPVRAALRRSILQMLLNLTLVTGVFLAAAYAGTHPQRWPVHLPAWTGGTKTVAWMGAMLLSLPLLVAVVRKLRAMAMLVAELSVPRPAAGRHTLTIRGVLTNTILLAGTVAIGLWILVLSLTILPPLNVLVVLLLLLALVVVMMWRPFVQIYARAQIAMRDTLSEAAHLPGEDRDLSAPSSEVLRGAQLRRIRIEPASSVAGRPLREVRLRTVTGASAVAIQRDDESIVNPGPEEHLLPGDVVMLLGNPGQLRAAQAMLGHKDKA